MPPTSHYNHLSESLHSHFPMPLRLRFLALTASVRWDHGPFFLYAPL